MAVPRSIKECQVCETGKKSWIDLVPRVSRPSNIPCPSIPSHPDFFFAIVPLLPYFHMSYPHAPKDTGNPMLYLSRSDACSSEDNLDGGEYVKVPCSRLKENRKTLGSQSERRSGDQQRGAQIKYRRMNNTKRSQLFMKNFPLSQPASQPPPSAIRHPDPA